MLVLCLFNAHKGIDNVDVASNVVWVVLMNVRPKFIMEKKFNDAMRNQCQW